MNLYKILPVCSLILLVACGDENSSFVASANATNFESETSSSSVIPDSVPGSASSSSKVAEPSSSSWSAAIGSTASSSSSQNVILERSDRIQ